MVTDVRLHQMIQIIRLSSRANKWYFNLWLSRCTLCFNRAKPMLLAATLNRGLPHEFQEANGYPMHGWKCSCNGGWRVQWQPPSQGRQCAWTVRLQLLGSFVINHRRPYPNMFMVYINWDSANSDWTTSKKSSAIYPTPHTHTHKYIEKQATKQT